MIAPKEQIRLTILIARQIKDGLTMDEMNEMLALEKLKNQGK